MDVLLVLLQLGVVPCKELQAFLFLRGQVILLQFLQQGRQQTLGVQIICDVIRLDAAGIEQIWSCFFNSLGQDPIDKEEIFNSLRMCQHSSLILRMVEVKLHLSFPQICPQFAFAGVLVKPREMGGDATVQSTNDVVKYLLIGTHLFILTLEAIFAVYELPYGRAIVIGERFYVGMDIEVLTLIVGFILHMPYPSFLLSPLIAPEVSIFGMRAYSIRLAPQLRDVLVTASAHRTTV